MADPDRIHALLQRAAETLAAFDVVNTSAAGVRRDLMALLRERASSDSVQSSDVPAGASDGKGE